MATLNDIKEEAYACVMPNLTNPLGVAVHQIETSRDEVREHFSTFQQGGARETANQAINAIEDAFDRLVELRMLGRHGYDVEKESSAVYDAMVKTVMHAHVAFMSTERRNPVPLLDTYLLKNGKDEVFAAIDRNLVGLNEAATVSEKPSMAEKYAARDRNDGRHGGGFQLA